MDDFLEQVIAEAWDYGARLSELDRRFGFKVSALFPTNVSKPQSAAGVFASFAIGDYGRVGSRIVASGPLFLWNICQVQLVGGKPCIGTTGEGYDLLERLDGLTAAIPHDRKYADIFFEYLQKRAPVDWAGFAAVLESVGSGITRPELVQAFETHWPEWTATKASTNTAGYVARAREWGLVGTKQIDRRYVLTEYGETLSEQLRTA